MKRPPFYLTVLFGGTIFIAAAIAIPSTCVSSPPNGKAPQHSSQPQRSQSPRQNGQSRPQSQRSQPQHSQAQRSQSQHSSQPQRSQPPRQNAQSRPPVNNGGSVHNNGGGGKVTRRVTTNALTGQVIKDERYGNDSPIHQTYRREPGRNPSAPQPFPGRHPGYNHGFYPPPPGPRPGYYPYDYPLFPAYPPPPPGFPPPPAFWPGFIVNGVTVWANSSAPVYPNVEQIGLYTVYNNMGVKSGSLLLYYKENENLLGGYFNPSGTKYTRSVEGIVSNVNGVPTAMFTVNDQYKTQCAVPMNQLVGAETASGIMTIPNQGLNDVVSEASRFTLKRIK